MSYYSQFVIADIPLILLIAAIAFALGVLFRDVLPQSDDSDES